ncbi:MAG: DNA methyltransferase, partial [Thermoprotei archaeon]
MSRGVYLLQFGDFRQLSKAEAYAFVIQHQLKPVHEDLSYMIVESPKRIDLQFGSILRVAEYYSDIEGFADLFSDDLSYFGDKIEWSVIFFHECSQEAERLRQQILSLIKKFNKKSIYINPTSLFSKQGGISLTRAIRKNLAAEGFEFVLSRWDNKIVVWRTIKHLDLQGFRERDLARPYKNPLISMPPWLARSMINMASPSLGAKLLDPFCGTGTILIEAVDSGLNAYGVDLDPHNVNGSRENLNWFQIKKKKATSLVILADSRHLDEHFPEDYFDLAVTEPPFGPPFNKSVKINEVRAIASRLSELYIRVFNSLSKVLKKGGVVVFTLPSWRLKSGGLYELRVEDILGKSGLEPEKRIGNAILPIRWSKPDNIIQRVINVARKPSS